MKCYSSFSSGKNYCIFFFYLGSWISVILEVNITSENSYESELRWIQFCDNFKAQFGIFMIRTCQVSHTKKFTRCRFWTHSYVLTNTLIHQAMCQLEFGLSIGALNLMSILRWWECMHIQTQVVELFWVFFFKAPMCAEFFNSSIVLCR